MSANSTIGRMPESGIRVLVADECATRRWKIHRVLMADTASHIVVVADAVDFDGLLAALKTSTPRVLIVHEDVLRALGSRAFVADAQLLAIGGSARTLLLTESTPMELAHAAICRHLWGCMSDRRVEQDLLKAVVLIGGGQMWFSRSQVTEILQARAEGAASASSEQIGLNGVTRRELEVAKLIVRGRTNKEIAQAMNISDLTVKTHVQNILKKFGVRRRGELSALMQAGESRAGPSAGAHELSREHVDYSV